MKLQTVVFDASTLILLAKAQLLVPFLRLIRGVMPLEVQKEVLAKPQADDTVAIMEMVQQGNLMVVESRRTAVEMRLPFGLDAGEAAALGVAKVHGWSLATDDGPGIRAAKVLGVPFLTSIHALVALKESGEIDMDLAMAKLDVLQKWGRYRVEILESARARLLGGG